MYIVEKKTTMLNFLLPCFNLFSPFFPSLPNVMHREIRAKDFSGAAAPRILKFRTNIEYDYLYCVKEI